MTWATKTLLSAIRQGYKNAKQLDHWPDEEPTVRRVIHQIQNELPFPVSIDPHTPCIAVAGSRIVLKVRNDLTNQSYALKICRPYPNAIELVGREYRNIQRLSHPNLVRIIWSRKQKARSADRSRQVPVTLEEFVSGGKTLTSWVTNNKQRAESDIEVCELLSDLREIMGQVLEGLHAMHVSPEHVFHCDIKPDNILVADSGVKIVDFGYSRRLLPRDVALSVHQPDDPIGFTWRFAHPALRRGVTKMEGPSAAFAYDDRKLPLASIDRYATGRTLEDCVLRIVDFHEKARAPGVDPGAARRRERQFWYFVRYLKFVAVRLKGTSGFEDEICKGDAELYPKATVGALQYSNHPSSLKTAIGDLRKMDLDDLSMIAPEWDPNIRDRVRCGNLDVPFSERLRKLINHPGFSRLATVSQLGVATFVYPSARQTRLEHSLGTYAYACKYIQSLWSQRTQPLFRCAATPDQLIGASLAALFHDLGQYPHCHDIEDSIPTMVRHQDLGERVYRWEFHLGGKRIPSLYAAVAEAWGAGVADTVPNFLGSHPGGDPSRPIESILWGVISGPIDADKMDYVQRDSTELGVAYGAGLEFDRLVSELAPILLTEGHRQTPGVSLGVGMKGILPAQSLVIAREQMYERVYWHKTVRAFKAMLSTALRRGLSQEGFLEEIQSLARLFIFLEDRRPRGRADRLASLLPSYPPPYPEALHLVATDAAMLMLIKNKLADEEAKHLVEMILRRIPYRPIFDLSSADWILPSDKDRIGRVVEYLRKATSLPTNDPGSLETLRVHLQKQLTTDLLISRRQAGPPSIPPAFRTRLVVLIDVPQDRAYQSLLQIAGPDTSYEREVDLGILTGGLEQGWAKSTQPRIYLHPDFRAEDSAHFGHRVLRACPKT